MLHRCVRESFRHLFTSVCWHFMSLWPSFLCVFFFSPSSRQLLMHLIYGTPAECVFVGVCLCVRVLVWLCGNAQAHSGTADEGMLLPLTHLMICLLLCVQRSREIPHIREPMSNTQQQCFLVQELTFKRRFFFSGWHNGREIAIFKFWGIS